MSSRRFMQVEDAVRYAVLGVHHDPCAWCEEFGSEGGKVFLVAPQSAPRPSGPPKTHQIQCLALIGNSPVVVEDSSLAGNNKPTSFS